MRPEPQDGIGLPSGYAIRGHRPDDDLALLGIENRAAELFRDHGYPDVADEPFGSVDDLRAMMAGHRVWVATTQEGVAAGFAVAAPLDAFFHLRELSVDPAHGRRGLGAALVRTVIRAGRAAGLAGVSLTTFRSVPFNAPFYAGLGFAELPQSEVPDMLAEMFEREVPKGVDASERVLMVRRY